MSIREPWLWDFTGWPATPYRGDDAVGRVHQCYCVGPRPGETYCPCQKAALLNMPAYTNTTKPRYRVKAISVPC